MWVLCIQWGAYLCVCVYAHICDSTPYEAYTNTRMLLGGKYIYFFLETYAHYQSFHGRSQDQILLIYGQHHKLLVAFCKGK